jgi:hypothetical protein
VNLKSADSCTYDVFIEMRVSKKKRELSSGKPQYFVLVASIGGSVINDCYGPKDEEAMDLAGDVNLFGGDR